MVCQMAQLQVESIMAAGAQPIRGLAAAGTQVELHRQLQMVFALVVAQQQIQFAQCLAVVTDRQIGGDHFDIRCSCLLYTSRCV